MNRTNKGRYSGSVGSRLREGAAKTQPNPKKATKQPHTPTPPPHPPHTQKPQRNKTMEHSREKALRIS